MTDTMPLPLEQVRLDYLAGNHEAARRTLEALPDLDLERAALLALCWVRQVLADRPHGACVDVPVLQAALSTPFADAPFEAERRFALGWLHWLAGSPALAESELAYAAEALPLDEATEAAYWLARVRISLGLGGAVAAFEEVMRSLPAAPRTTCAFVDLLWRSKQFDRAEAVWKVVGDNRRVQACDEAPLLAARALLRRGEAARAEALLREARPRGGVAGVERLLMLARAAAARHRVCQAADLLRQAEAGPYPPADLQAWRRALGPRSGAEDAWPEA